jgi:hypothetical protein
LTNGHIKLGIVLKILPRLAVEYFEKLSQRLPQALANRLLAQMAVRFQKAARHELSGQ